MALFITFEGGEGSGKTFQAKALYRRLVKLDIPVLLTHEPGGTVTGEKVTRLLKWASDADLSPVTELLLFNASRAQLVKEVIKPALENSKVVICDRYTDSTIAYQSYGRGLDLGMVKGINDIATRGLIPALIVLMDLPVEEGFNRKKSEKRDRFEKEAIEFHQKVREGYHKLADSDTRRWLVIDASQSKQKVKDIIWQKVKHLLEIN
ncbi:dTMP kinase [Chloroflexota bacterium]